MQRTPLILILDRRIGTVLDQELCELDVTP
jgi:hypothetical protein